jgi:deoxycytidylate deaminase
MITGKDHRMMQFVRRQAIDVKPIGAARISAAVAIRNDIISTGYCQKRTHPFQARYSKNPDSIYLHAETNAISNSLNHIGKDVLAKATLYIHRVKHPGRGSGEWIDGMARPCPGCMRAILAFGLKKVVYSTEENGKYQVLEATGNYQ